MRRESAYGALVTGRDGKLQRDGRQCVNRIVTLNSHRTFQRKRPLCSSIRGEQTDWRSLLTGYQEIVLVGAQIIVEETSKIDSVTILSDLRPE